MDFIRLLVDITGEMCIRDRVVSIISPLYISEVAVAQYRGRLVSLYQLAVTIGFLGAYLVNYQLLGYSMSNPDVSTGWWNMVFVSAVSYTHLNNFININLSM